MPPIKPRIAAPRHSPINVTFEQSGGVEGVTLYAVRCTRCSQFYAVSHVRNQRCYVICCPLCSGRRAVARAAVRRRNNRLRMRVARSAAKAAA